MYRIVFLFLLISSAANAQIQFWTKDEIIEKQFQPARKEMQVREAVNYVTSERFQVSDTSDYNEIFEYDKEGRKTVYKKYRTDWVKRRKYFQVIDSVFYNDKGVFSSMRQYGPGPDGNYYQLEWQAKAVYNAKGQIERINQYRGYQASEQDGYDLYVYDAKQRPIKITNYDAAKKKNMEWTFQYDAKGNVSKIRANSGFGFTDYIAKYNAAGLLASYTELYNGKEKSGEATYIYDNTRRLIRRDYMTPHNYLDTTQYGYNGTDSYYSRTYLKYPRISDGRPDFAHEFRVYMFRRRQ